MRETRTMYCGQRDWRGRPEVYRDLGDGSGPCRLRFRDEEHKDWLLPDWGKTADLSRRRMLALALLSDALGDAEWALQIGLEFSKAVVERLPHTKWQMTAGDIFVAVSAIEQGLTFEVKRR